MEVTVQVPLGRERVSVLGAAERNLKMIREALGVNITARDKEVRLKGDRTAVSVARGVLERLGAAADRDEEVSREQVLLMIADETDRHRTGVGRGGARGAHVEGPSWDGTIDVYSAGADIYLRKKINISAYYTLSAGKGNVSQRFLGDPTITTGTNAFLLTGTNSATPYPETVDRNHEVGLIVKYKLTERLTPRFEYRYQQWDNRDYQTTVMTPYMGCVSSAPPAAPVPNCTSPILNSATSPTPVPGASSPFYPGFVVGDPSAARYLFLGVDQPSYHVHIFTATIEYRF